MASCRQREANTSQLDATVTICNNSLTACHNLPSPAKAMAPSLAARCSQGQQNAFVPRQRCTVSPSLLQAESAEDNCRLVPCTQGGHSWLYLPDDRLRLSGSRRDAGSLHPFYPSSAHRARYCLCAQEAAACKAWQPQQCRPCHLLAHFVACDRWGPQTVGGDTRGTLPCTVVWLGTNRLAAAAHCINRWLAVILCASAYGMLSA